MTIHQLPRRHATQRKPAVGSRVEDKTTPRWVPWLLVVATFATVVLGVLLTRGAMTTEDEKVALQGTVGAVEVQRDAAVGQSVDLAIQVQNACATGGLEPGDRLCVRAAEVRAQPIPGERGPAGPGPTPEQLRVAVADYLAANPPAPGPAPSADDVAAAVSAYLTAHPPTPGRAPTAEEIAAAVTTWFASNPVRDGQDGTDGRNGVDGGQGERGPGPTQDEIRAAVEAELAENPPPAGPPGADGEDGSPAQSYTTTYDDGSTQTCTLIGGTDQSPVYACGPLTPPAAPPAEPPADPELETNPGVPSG
jgi:hypothetical protein